jgi:hypothetical protein
MSSTWKVLSHLSRHVQGEAGLADPAGTRDRDQAHTLTHQKFFEGRHFFLAPYKSGALHRKIRRAGFHRLYWFF